MIKTLSKVSTEKTYFNIIKAIYDKPTAKIILNCEKMKCFLLNSGIRESCPFSPLVCIQHTIGSPSHSSQTRKRIKKISKLEGKR